MKGDRDRDKARDQKEIFDLEELQRLAPVKNKIATTCSTMLKYRIVYIFSWSKPHVEELLSSVGG